MFILVFSKVFVITAFAIELPELIVSVPLSTFNQPLVPTIVSFMIFEV